MIFLLPAGIMDGVLSSVVLVLILVPYFHKRKIVND